MWFKNKSQGNCEHRFSAVIVLSLCLVKYDLSLRVGLCAVSMLKGRNSLTVISDVLFM